MEDSGQRREQGCEKKKNLRRPASKHSIHWTRGTDFLREMEGVLTDQADLGDFRCKSLSFPSGTWETLPPTRTTLEALWPLITAAFPRRRSELLGCFVQSGRGEKGKKGRAGSTQGEKGQPPTITGRRMASIPSLLQARAPNQSQISISSTTRETLFLSNNSRTLLSSQRLPAPGGETLT